MITGAAQGIGFEIARAVHARGAMVGMVDVKADVVAAASSIGNDAVGVVADVTNLQSTQAALDELAQQLGGIDVLVINAGIGPLASTLDAKVTMLLQQHLDVNLNGCLHTLWAGGPLVVEAKGHILFISSITAFAAVPLTGAYGVSKAGVEMAARVARLELAPTGATVGVAFLGPVETEMVTRYEEDELVLRMQALHPAEP